MTERQQSKLNSTSRFLSLILRHKPEAAGITLDEHGWADVGELIAGIRKTRDFDMELLKEIVKTDNKQRYSFSEDYTRIRANQGIPSRWMWNCQLQSRRNPFTTEPDRNM